MQRVLLSLLFVVVLLLPADAADRWKTLPQTPPPVANARTGYADVNGIKLYYADTGSGPVVLLLHGGLANSDYLSNQARALAAAYRVILVDSRGHGRSTRDGQPFSYDLMADDIVGLLDVLKIDKAAVIGWSDGGIIGLDLAMRHPERVTRVFAFGANTSTSGLKDDLDQNPTFAEFIERAGREYARLSATPREYTAFRDQIGQMWNSEPNWTDAQLRGIRTPVWIVDGEHDEGIKREHTEYMAATIPGARLVILPDASHFAFLQDHETFNKEILAFLREQQPAGSNTAQ